MSIQVMSRVWQNSKAKSGALLVLLAIADFADDEGNAFPSVETLAEKSRMSERNVQLSIRRLQQAGELSVKKPGKHRANTYKILVRGANISGEKIAPVQIFQVKPTSPQGEAHFTPRVKPTSPEPSITIIEPSVSPNGEEPVEQTVVKASTTREIQVEFEKVCGYPIDWKAGAGRAAKWLAENGYAAVDVAECYKSMKSDEFWRDKQLSLDSVKKRIGEFVKTRRKAMVTRNTDGSLYI